MLFAASLMASTLSVVVFLVPATYHRLTSHRRRAERIQVGVRAALAGVGLFSLAIVLDLLVVARLIFGTVVAGVLAGTVAVTIVGLWFAFPVLRERAHGREATEHLDEDGDA